VWNLWLHHEERERPRPVRLRRIAAETQTRGHHAFGLAWLGATGTIHTSSAPAPPRPTWRPRRMPRRAAVIGHCRWATHGRPENNRNNHPHPAGRGWIVHNGVVQNHAALVRRYGLSMTTECDSEVLGLLMAGPRRPRLRAARAAEVADGNLAMLGLWRNPTRLLVVRRGNPLCFVRPTADSTSAACRASCPARS